MSKPKENGDISAEARSIAREIDRLPKNQIAAVYLRKDDKGRVVYVELCTQERLRLWLPDTEVIGP